jgi:4-amino-4-deoxy-L-arabinose transferase-like glycosyltransferase
LIPLEPAEQTGPALAAPADAEQRLLRIALLLIAVLTLLRLAFLLNSPLDLDVEEAQYWSWARMPAWGYFSKPPLIAWLIALATRLCGDGAACIRSASPLLHAATALSLVAAGLALGSRKLGAWAAMLYASMPGVAFSAMLMTTDVPLLFFWSVALVAFLRLRRGGGLGWAVLGGIAVGLGSLSKYAMLFFLAGAALYLVLSREGRRAIGWRGPAIMVALMLLALLPNILWNAAHTWVTVASTAETAESDKASFQLKAVLNYALGQFAIFGPMPMVILLGQGLAWCRGRLAPAPVGALLGRDEQVLLLCLSLPFFLPFLLLAVVGQANANWTAYAYVAGCLLVAAVASDRWRRLIVGAHIWTGPVIYGAILLTLHWPMLPGLAHVVERMAGWRPLGAAVAENLAKDRPARLLTFDRSLTALLIYYARVPPGGYVVWNPHTHPDNHYELVASLKPGDPGPLLLVSGWQPGYVERWILGHFDRVVPAAIVEVPLFTGNRRLLYLYRVSGFRGYGP